MIDRSSGGAGEAEGAGLGRPKRADVCVLVCSCVLKVTT